VRQGLQAARVAAELNALFSSDNCVVFSDAAAWDDDWMKTLFAASGLKRRFVVLPIADRLNHSEQERFKQRSSDLREQHRTRIHRVGVDIEIMDAAYLYASAASL
jgi:hypothetical protein